MGKLGGRELNYSSDIDLIFVHGDDEDARTCVRLAEAMRETLAKATPSGYLFRVDLRLRPEGRFGPVSRSLTSCRTYYESWAEPWERQALLKARAVAGEGRLGTEFIEMTQAFIYQSRIEESVVESIRQNKRRLEEKIARAGQSDINVKEGYGGIRDIEFPVQLMQLLSGGSNPSVRTVNTLEALDRLTGIGQVTDEERAVLRESYIFLRTVEHRLQLLDDRAVRCLPREQGALKRLGRVMGFAEGQAFLCDYRMHTERVHHLFERLFSRQASGEESEEGLIRRWVLSPDDPAAQEALRRALAERGFADPEVALRYLRSAVADTQYGDILPEARAGFGTISEALLDASQQTACPDDALRGIVSLAQAVPSSAVLYQMFVENPGLLSRFCRLAGEAGSLWHLLLTHLEFLDLLADEEAMDRPLSLPTSPDTPLLLARFALRSRLHTGARDIWGLADAAETAVEITAASETILSLALGVARSQLGTSSALAVIGLGKLGGSELGYGSDWDVLYMGETDDLAGATLLAERTQHLLREELQREGVRFEIDARLRPEGRKGALVLDAETYRKYYTDRAATWERQALVKARFVAGDPSLGREFITLIQSIVYARPVTGEEVEEIRAMKRRLETERSKGPSDLKLGPGGLSDVEWGVQLLQLLHGYRRRALRVTGTLTALRALRDDALVTQEDWDALDRSYRLVSQLRNRRFLQNGVSTDSADALPESVQAVMREARVICCRLFYGEKI